MSSSIARKDAKENSRNRETKANSAVKAVSLRFVRLMALSAALMLASAHSVPANAAPVTFTIDPARSGVTISGSLTVPAVGTYPYKTQGSGSLTTSYGGTIVVELEPPRILFPGGSDIQFETNGTWQPVSGGGAGSQPANYAGETTPPFTTTYFAARNIAFDAVGEAILLANGSFNATNLTEYYLTNHSPQPVIDYRVSSSVPGDSTSGVAPLAGALTNAAVVATLSSGSGLLTLVVPVEATITRMIGSYPSTTILNGQITATAPASAWPLVISINIESGKTTLSWPSLPGQSFIVQSTPNLTGSWSTATGSMNTANGTTTWTPSTSPGSPQFYRVVGHY